MTSLRLQAIPGKRKEQYISRACLPHHLLQPQCTAEFQDLSDFSQFPGWSLASFSSLWDLQTFCFSLLLSILFPLSFISLSLSPLGSCCCSMLTRVGHFAGSTCENCMCALDHFCRHSRLNLLVDLCPAWCLQGLLLPRVHIVQNAHILVTEAHMHLTLPASLANNNVLER